MENAELDKVVPSFKKVIPFIERNAHSYNIEGYIFFLKAIYICHYSSMIFLEFEV